MTTVSFHPEAKAELFAAARWYERQRSGLGAEFRQEAKAAISRIAHTPETFGVVGHEVRCHVLHRFPYGILYQIHDRDILIVAVMHLHREPGYWEHRAEY